MKFIFIALCLNTCFKHKTVSICPVSNPYLPLPAGSKTDLIDCSYLANYDSRPFQAWFASTVFSSRDSGRHR